MRTTSKTAGEPHMGLLMIASADGEPLYAIEASLAREAHQSRGERLLQKSYGSVGTVIFRRGDAMYAT
jgi:hypothetical protein